MCIQRPYDLVSSRYATERAHKLHRRAAGPFRVRRKINPNAYDVTIPPDWGIPTTFNIGNLLPYQGPLEVPSEPGLPPDSTESSLLELEENDGPHSPAKAITVDDDLATPTGTEEDNATPDECTERPRRLAKLTTQFSDFVYY